jgi:hypothetical protein
MNPRSYAAEKGSGYGSEKREGCLQPSNLVVKGNKKQDNGDMQKDQKKSPLLMA